MGSEKGNKVFAGGGGTMCPPLVFGDPPPKRGWSRVKVARNEVKNAWSLAQHCVHREVKKMATGIDRIGCRAQVTYSSCHSEIFNPSTR